MINFVDFYIFAKFCQNVKPKKCLLNSRLFLGYGYYKGLLEKWENSWRIQSFSWKKFKKIKSIKYQLFGYCSKMECLIWISIRTFFIPIS